MNITRRQLLRAPSETSTSMKWEEGPSEWILPAMTPAQEEGAMALETEAEKGIEETIGEEAET